ncbi:MAG: TlyA family RNA methyltransferase [Saprospiraceae bacterium]|nr:TlyA family RNA methyltransferase [Saprospiraceae bacterium]
MRIDTWLVQNGHFASRERAHLALKAGRVMSNGRPVGKPSHEVQPSDKVEVKGDPLPYVSRGGLKLQKAIRTFQIDFQGLTVLDVGASTGGFTDCALQHGAAKVVAVDVGTSQLVASLRNDPRVVFYEDQDVRKLSLEQMGGQPADALVCDVSFISLTHVLPAFPSLLKPGGFAVLLIKPQFELEQRRALKGGIVKEEKLRQQAIRRVLDCALGLGFRQAGLVETDVEAEGKKNLEYLVLLHR